MSDLRTTAPERKLLTRIAASLLPALLIIFFVVLTANGVNLGGNYLITWVTTSLADAYNWRHAYIAVINYVAVYGNAENWRESSNITAASILIPMILLAFITRELIVERPLLPLGNLKIDSLIKNKKNGNIKIGKLTAAKLGLLSDQR